MSGGIKYIPLSFVSSAAEKERLIRNTVLLRHFACESKGDVRLSHYIEGTQYGFNAAAKETGTNRYVRISDISNGEIAWETVPFCDCDDPKSYLLNKHDIVVARTGGTTGKSYMVSTPPPKGSIYAGYLIRVRANSETNPLFLSVFLNSYLYWSQITSLNRDEFRPSVNAEKLKALVLPTFDRTLQDRIVRLSNNPTDGADSSIRGELDSVLSKRNQHEIIVAEIEHQQSLLATLKQAILQEAIHGKLTVAWRTVHSDLETANQLLHRIQAEKARLIAAKKIRPEKPLPKITPAEIPFEIPKGWEWCRATYPAYLIPDRDKKIPTSQILSAGKYPVVDQGKVLIRGFTNNTECLIELDGPIVLFGDHTREAKYIDFNFVVGADGVKLLRPVLVNPKYYHLALSSVRIEAKNYARHFKFLKESFIPLPPLAEQAVIVERVEAMMTTCRALETEIAQARTHAVHLIQAVLKEAFAPAANTVEETAKCYA